MRHIQGCTSKVIFTREYGFIYNRTPHVACTGPTLTKDKKYEEVNAEEAPTLVNISFRLSPHPKEMQE